MHNMSGDDWDTWNRKIRGLLVNSQVRNVDQCADGSWDPAKDAWGKRGGRLMQTSLSALTLEVYYQYLPIFKHEAGSDEPAAETPTKPEANGAGQIGRKSRTQTPRRGPKRSLREALKSHPDSAPANLECDGLPSLFITDGKCVDSRPAVLKSGGKPPHFKATVREIACSLSVRRSPTRQSPVPRPPRRSSPLPCPSATSSPACPPSDPARRSPRGAECRSGPRL